MQLTIYAENNCFLRRKIEAAAAIAGVALERKVEKDYDTTQCQWVRFPGMMTPHGMIFGSDAAIRYIAETHSWTELYGKDLTARTWIDTMLSVIASDFETPMFAVAQVGKDVVTQDILKGCEKANQCLEKTSFIAGDRMSIADISLAAAIVGAVDTLRLLTTSQLAKYVHLVRMVNTVSGRAGWGVTIKADASQTAAPEVKKEHPKKEQPKKAAPQQTEAPPAPPKEKDPIELLPPNDFDVDAWKRCYSNNGKKLKEIAMPYLWEHMEKAGLDGWSFWHLKYLRCNDTENTQVFLASNLLGMFLQRIDNWLRKYMFGVCNVFEEEGYFGVEGVMFWRGQEVPKRLKEHDQFESFEWTKLDVNEAKQLITDFFCEGEEINGKKIAGCKVYK